ncbi:MAG: hypothetical protein QG597_1784 [Actinomycetota bacterium]|nr:hypothetical protein [Actinomycetota bacterium]
MRIVEVHLHKLIVPMQPDTVNSPGLERPLTAAAPVSGRRRLDFAESPRRCLEWIPAALAAAGLTSPPEG